MIDAANVAQRITALEKALEVLRSNTGQRTGFDLRVQPVSSGVHVELLAKNVEFQAEGRVKVAPLTKVASVLIPTGTVSRGTTTIAGAGSTTEVTNTVVGYGICYGPMVEE